MKCPKCGSEGGGDKFDYKYPILVPNVEPGQTAWYMWYVWMCYKCGVYFVSKETVK